MGKTIRILGIALINIIMICALVALAGCGAGSGSGSESGEEANQAASDSAAPAFDLSQIDWTVESGIIDGYRVVVFGYTNNTDYEVVDFDLRFKVKDDVTDDQLEQYSELKKKAK